MTTPRVADEILEFYGETINEAERLTISADGRLEMLRTQELLRRHLPRGGRSILDVGGGPGAHARWLLEDGHTVHLIDPVPRHVAAALEVGCSAELGDARALSAADNSYDVVLLMGPLYHLLEEKERLQALAEARRVVRPGGVVAAAAIGRYSSLVEQAVTGLLGVKESVREAVADILRTGVHEPGRKGFTAAYFHTPEGLEAEMAAAGIDACVYGVEGPTWGALKAAELAALEPLEEDAPLFVSALAAARLADPYRQLLAASSHLLAIGRA
ncbi:class I SAM-dependent methyltransferase [Streptomyces noursei]